jgi:predicted amidohydrolase YtcJ
MVSQSDADTSSHTTGRTSSSKARVQIVGRVSGRRSWTVEQKLEPYADLPGARGESYWLPKESAKAVTRLDRGGFKILIHATGNRATKEALDAYEAARRAKRRKDSLFRIEHAEHLNGADIPRFASLGIIAGVQPLFVPALWNAQEARLGLQRGSLAFPWRSIVSTGGRLTLGSDLGFSMNPWEQIHELVTRRNAPEQRLTLADWIQGYTLGAARADGFDKTEGSRETGKVAKLIIVSRNLFETDPHEIGKTKVFLTMVGGKVVYQAP